MALYSRSYAPHGNVYLEAEPPLITVEAEPLLSHSQSETGNEKWLSQGFVYFNLHPSSNYRRGRASFIAFPVSDWEREMERLYKGFVYFNLHP